MLLAPPLECQINNALESWTLCASINVLKTQIGLVLSEPGERTSDPSPSSLFGTSSSSSTVLLREHSKIILRSALNQLRLFDSKTIHSIYYAEDTFHYSRI